MSRFGLPLTLALLVPGCVADAESVSTAQLVGDTWGPVVDLRDNSNAFPDGKPPGGWWVTPIHANLLANGKVLVTGWSRHDRESCVLGGTRRHGTTFVVDPDDLTASSFGVTPIDEHGSPAADVLYCSGQAPMPDGKILFTGGSSYLHLGTPTEQEFGLDYARVYDPMTDSFTRVASPMGGGPSGNNATWYPTNTRLADGRILVTGGFTRCCGDQFANNSVQIFDPSAFDHATNPWTTLVPHDQSRSELTPGLRDYTHTILLPRPVHAGGHVRDVALVGAQGKTLLLSTTPGVPANQRLVLADGGARPGNAAAWDSTAALLSTGELLTMGGTSDPAIAQRADLYNPATRTWRSVDTGIGRHNASSVLLPDGTVLLINGENGNGFAGDRRRPQIFDPATGNVTTLAPWPDDSKERGYHNMALLLEDGRVLIGGGTSSAGGIGCERADLRIYNPPYFSLGARPILVGAAEPTAMTIGGDAVSLEVSNGPLRARGGVVLMAHGSFTHAFDQNQRYVPLDYTLAADGTLRVTPPATDAIAPQGDYILYLVSAAGVPSVGKSVRLARSPSFQRTVIFVRGQTQPGQDMFLRGGFDHQVAATTLGITCTSSNFKCAIPIRHRNLLNGTTSPWKLGDTFLDWYGPEAGQTTPSHQLVAQGTAADWTTRQWTFGNPKRTVAVDGFGEEPLNIWGDHFWMIDVDMDCSKAIDGTWFELKTFISNGPGWEPDVHQANTPYASGNHFARCGMVNMFERGSSAATFRDLP